MQFEPEESGEERRRRQRDYHAFLDAQVEARSRKPAPEDDRTDPAGNPRLPVLPLSARLKYQPSPGSYGADSFTNFARPNGKGPAVGDGSGCGVRGTDHRAEIAIREEHVNRIEQRLEEEVQRRHLVERNLAALGQKLENWMSDSTVSLKSLGARDEVVTKVQEMTQQQVKALEEEARTRIQADETRSSRFRQAVERVSGDVENLARKLEAEDNGTLQRVAKFEAAFKGEAKGAREATKQLVAQVQALDADVAGSERKMSSLLQSLRQIESRQREQLSVAAEARKATDGTEQLREQVRTLSAAVSGSDSKMNSLLQALQALEKRQQDQHSVGNARKEEKVSKQQIQESLMAATSVKLDLLRSSLADELSGMMGDIAKRAVESTNVPQLMAALRGRVEHTEERLNNMADKSFRAMEDELSGVRTEVTRLEGRIDTGPIAAGLKVLSVSTKEAQAATQSQLTELQDALSAEITARRRNAVRLAEAQAATKEGGRESAVQAASGLRARCLELEELVARLTRDIKTAQEDISSQTQTQLAASQEHNSRAVGKLEESLAGIRMQMAQQVSDGDRNIARVTARVDELEGVITTNKDLLREAEERARNGLAAMEAKRQEQAKQFADKIAGVESEEMARIQAIELAMAEQGNTLKEAFETGHRTNKRRSDEIYAEVKRLEGSLRTALADAQEDESERVNSLLHQAQEQILREKITAEETARIDGVQDLHRDLSRATEASYSRTRLWAEDQLRKERAAMEESLERTQAQSGMIRTLLDEAVKAVSKELDILRAESRDRNLALEEVLDERASGLEERITEIDNGSAKKRRVNELTRETGARIGEVERRVRQAEKELKEELEVKLAVSSMVCSVADKASTQRLEQSSLEVVRLEEVRKAGAMENEASLKAELAKTNAVVASLKADIGVARAWQTGVDNLEVKLMARIEELRAMAEAAESAAAIAKADASAALEAEAKHTSEDTSSSVTRNDLEVKTLRGTEPLDVEGAAKAQGQLGKKGLTKKAMDFAAMNDELEADEKSSTQSSSSSRPDESDAKEDDDNTNRNDDASNLNPRVSDIEKELVQLKQRLEEGIAEMDALRQEILGAGSAVRTPVDPERGTSASPQPSSQRDASSSQEGTNGDRQDAVGERRRSRRVADQDQEGVKRAGDEVQQPRRRDSRARSATEVTDGNDAPTSSGSDVDSRSRQGAENPDEERQVSSKEPSSPGAAHIRNRVPSSQTSRASYTPPLSPTSAASYTPPISPKSDGSGTTGRRTDASRSQSERQTEASGSENEASGSDRGSQSDSESEGGRSRQSSADQGDQASRREEEGSAGQESDEARDRGVDGSSSRGSETASNASEEDGSSGVDDDGRGSERGTEDARSRGSGGGSDEEAASESGSVSGSDRSGETRDRSASDDGTGSASGKDSGQGSQDGRDLSPARSSGGTSEASDEDTEGSSTPRRSERSNSSGTVGEGEDDERSESSRSKAGKTRSRSRSSSSD
ncbi:hypothetical protein Esi_0086_0080 [Ectocarpus siliculosus]|uniref:Uncharacterized protein n=1 Tax=Ectocarpus siliculosus TaxID=2880 RepID=D7G811_ECTSI|nr:hypothetical protein Esi_0086_0080 [Ectocarpus siliculosus]|eukprot:CBJ27886.1 hypothetical protein Esi_0086_0080 [Ectocarpus siliculosus]